MRALIKFYCIKFIPVWEDAVVINNRKLEITIKMACGRRLVDDIWIVRAIVVCVGEKRGFYGGNM